MGKIYTVTEQPNTGWMAIITVAIVVVFFVAIYIVPVAYVTKTSALYALFFVGLIISNAIFERKNRRQLQINDRQFVITKTGDELGIPEYIHRDQVKKSEFFQIGGKAKSLLLIITLNDETKRKFKIRSQDIFNMFQELYLNTNNQVENEDLQKALRMSKRFISGKEMTELIEQINTQATDQKTKIRQEAMTRGINSVTQIAKMIRWFVIGVILFIFLSAFIAIVVPSIIGMIN